MSWDGNERRRNFSPKLSDRIIAHMARTENELSSINKNVGDLVDKVKIQNGRIGKLENWRSYIIGAIAAAGFILGYLLKVKIGG